MKRIVPALLFMVVLLGLWELAVIIFTIPEYLLPSPVCIGTRLVNNHSTLIIHLGITAFEAIVGFSLGTVFGVLLAVIFVHSKTAEMSMDSRYLNIMNKIITHKLRYEQFDNAFALKTDKRIKVVLTW